MRLHLDLALIGEVGKVTRVVSKEKGRKDWFYRG